MVEALNSAVSAGPEESKSRTLNPGSTAASQALLAEKENP